MNCVGKRTRRTEAVAIGLAVGFMALFLTGGPVHAQWSERATGTVFLTGGWIFDGVSDQRFRNRGVLIEDGRITATDGSVVPGDGTNVRLIELADNETLIPGMIDLHAHYNFDLVDKGRAEEVHYNGLVFLANGVTSTWSAGEYFPERVIRQRDLIDAGETDGPRLLSSGPYFGAFRCEYAVRTAADDCIAWPNDLTEKELRAEVDRWVAQGAVSLKIKQASAGELSVIVDQAHKRGVTATAHLGNYDEEWDVPLRDAIMMGLDRVEHRLTIGKGGPLSDDMDLIVSMMIEHGVFYDPNLQMYGSVHLREEIGSDMTWTDESRFFTEYAQGLLRKRGPPPPESDHEEFSQRVRELMALYEAGGGHLIVVGTDEPVYTDLLPGFAYHRELLAMSYLGLPNVAALKAATINGARALGLDDRIGSIEPGKLADMSICIGDPTGDIRAARNLRLVLKGGEVFEPEFLLASAEGSIGPSGPGDHDDWEIRIKPYRSDD